MDSVPSTPGKFKGDKPHYYNPRLAALRWYNSPTFCSKLAIWSFVALLIYLAFYAISTAPSSASTDSIPLSAVPRGLAEHHRRSLATTTWGGPDWEKRVRSSAAIRVRDATDRPGISVLVTGAAGFVGSHVSLALKRRGEGVLGLDNFNNYYDQELKRARQDLLDRAGVFIVEGDINDAALLRKLFDVVPFTHIMHLAAQAGVRYAMTNPGSYIHSNVAGLVSIFEVAKSVDPQPSIVWASSSSVYGLNTHVPFSEADRTDRPASLYAATKKAGEEIAHVYNHIYGLAITGLRFFTVYGPWGRPDMAYFFFTKDILRGELITIFEGADHTSVARDFTFIDDIVRGCVSALDNSGKSTGTSSGKKNGNAPLHVYNLGNTSPVPVNELVSILERLLKRKANKKIVRMPRNGDVPFTHANISLAQRELRYHPTTDLSTGLKKFVQWYLDYYSPSKKSTITGDSRSSISSSSSSI